MKSVSGGCESAGVSVFVLWYCDWYGFSAKNLKTSVLTPQKPLFYVPFHKLNIKTKWVGIRNEKSAKPYISRVSGLSESLVIQKWYCIRLSHINFIQEKTSLVWTLSSFERGIFYALFSVAWYCEFCCADFTNFRFLKSFF